ncbi:MAG TPA: 1-deoxy-D-xylulose-5-phosphate reductoisomerase, partial [Daejeonella sp.]|nr:1-deoxy-D-xylulose-5-phosphate reductoisomerase [Daejeonella sp.]
MAIHNIGKEEFKRRSVAILGSTGSIGTQALEVIRQNPDRFRVSVLTAQTNADLLIQQALEFQPDYVVIGDESRCREVEDALRFIQAKVLCGLDELSAVVAHANIDIVLTALVGFAGLKPT